jgi:hypothetical protein
MLLSDPPRPGLLRSLDLLFCKRKLLLELEQEVLGLSVMAVFEAPYFLEGLETSRSNAKRSKKETY